MLKFGFNLFVMINNKENKEKNINNPISWYNYVN